MPSGLREAWELEVDADDEYGVGPDAALRAGLPHDLSRAFDGARSAVGIATPLSEQIRETLVAPARASAGEPWPSPLLSQYARFWRDGVRTDYEDDVRRLGIMTGEAVLAALATGQHRWIDRAADGLMLLCELSTWCWVAHEQSHERRRWVLPDPEAPVVDLGAAQTLQVVAWADLALGDELDARVPGLRQRMRREAKLRVLSPYLSRRDWHWLHGRAHNWTGWIHQHLIAGALFLLDEDSDRAQRDATLALSVAQLDRYLVSFPGDGGIDEGLSYFWNGASRLLEAIDLLVVASGGALDREAVAGIDVIGHLLRFPQRMDLGEGWYVNVADGPARPPAEQPWDVLHRWGRHLGAADVSTQALAHRGDGPVPPVTPQLGLGRVLTAISDPHWCAAEGEGARAPYPADTWLPEVELLVVREREGDPSGLTLAVKGGHNDEAHNHLDVGSYLVAADSSPVLIDLGQPTYTAATFTDRRYDIWTMTSSWHNLPEIRGHRQGIGAQYSAREVRAALRPGGDPSSAAAFSALELDLAGAYPAVAGVRSYRRRAALESGATVNWRAADQDGRGGEGRAGTGVRISDSWQLDPVDTVRSEPAVVLHHVIAGEIIEHRAGLLRVRSLSRVIVDLRWDRGLGPGQLEQRAVDDPLLQQSWGDTVHRLRLCAPTDHEGSGCLDLTVDVPELATS